MDTLDQLTVLSCPSQCLLPGKVTMIVVVSIFFVLFLLTAFWWRNTRIPHKFPPGPYGLPFIGHLDTVKSGNWPRALKKLGDKYGSICSVNIDSGKRVVIIGDYPGLMKIQ